MVKSKKIIYKNKHLLISGLISLVLVPVSFFCIVYFTPLICPNKSTFGSCEVGWIYSTGLFAIIIPIVFAAVALILFARAYKLIHKK